MPAKRKTRTTNTWEEEQVLLLRHILAELQRLNASLATIKGVQGMVEPDKPSSDSDDEELEEYE